MSRGTGARISYLVLFCLVRNINTSTPACINTITNQIKPTYFQALTLADLEYGASITPQNKNFLPFNFYPSGAVSSTLVMVNSGAVASELFRNVPSLIRYSGPDVKPQLPEFESKAMCSSHTSV